MSQSRLLPTPPLTSFPSRSFFNGKADILHEDKHNEVIMLRAHQLQQRCYAGKGGDLTEVEKKLKPAKIVVLESYQ